MKALVIKDTIIENIIVVDSLDVFPNLSEYIEGADIGDKVIDGVLVKVEKTISVETMKQYLTDTEWVESYYIKHLAGLELIPTESSKWSIIDLREQYKLQLRSM